MPTIAEELDKASVTDSLIRDENPLAGDWTKPSWDVKIGRLSATEGGFGGWIPETAYSTGADGARYDGAALAVSGDMHAYCIVECDRYSNTQIAERWWGAWCLLHASAQSGYRVIAEMTGTNQYTIRLQKAVAGTITDLATKTEVLMFTGSGGGVGELAVVVGHGTVYAYLKISGGEWEEIAKVEDATYSEGVCGFEARGNFARLQNFRIGTFELGVAAPPEVATGVASSISDTTAVLNGTVDANNAPTDYYFEYGLTTSYGAKVPVTEDGDAGDGPNPVPVAQKITGLSPTTTYHFRLVAKSAEGEDVGSDAEFTTDAEGKFVNVKVGGVVVQAKRWLKVGSELINI